jgi:formate-dependent nitrite reductase membrane component NrfD
MTLGMRKIIVTGVVAAILLLANFFVLARWLDSIGLIPWAQTVRDRYITGTAITIIAVLLVLIVPQARIFIVRPEAQSRCRVCDRVLDRPGQYCPTCGSRI